MTWRILKNKFVIALLVSIFGKSASTSCGGIAEEDAGESCCWMSGDGKASCSNIRFKSFPPFPPRDNPPHDRGCPEWCGTEGNARIFKGSEVTRFVLTNVTIAAFNKEALRQYPNVEEFVVTQSTLPRFQSHLFYFDEREGQSKITTISINQSNITGFELDAFYDLQALKKLSLGRNLITSLPVGVFDHLVNLRYLFLSGSRLSSPDPAIFSHLRNLEELHLSENPLKWIGAFPKLPRLRSLYLKATSLKIIEADAFSQLESLDTIDLRQNHLKSLPEDIFSANRRLERVYLKDNELEDLPGKVFSSLCNLISVDLRNNRLTTPKVGYMATVFDSKNDPTRDDVVIHALTGNPWKCNDIDNAELKEYALFVSTVHRYNEVQNVLHGLMRYINIYCNDTGDLLVNPSTMSSPVLNHLTETDRGNLLERNDCKLLKTKIPQRPACPFISPACNGTKATPLTGPPGPPGQLVQDGVPTYYFFIGGGLLAVIVVLSIWNKISRQPVKRKRHYTDDSIVMSDSSSQSPSTLCPSDVIISEETVFSPQAVPLPNQALRGPPSPVPTNIPISPLEAGSFSFSNSSSTLHENKHDDITDDVDNDAISENSETDIKELYQTDNSDRTSREFTRPSHTHLTKPCDTKGDENIYEKASRKQTVLPDDSGYAAADFVPSQLPQAMPGYLAMRPIGLLCDVTMNDELLPGNPHRPLPSLPALYSVMSQHLYASIKNCPTMNHTPPVNQTVGGDGSTALVIQPFQYAGVDVNVDAQFLAKYSHFEGTDTLNADGAASQGQNHPGTDCPEDNDGYLLPLEVQQRLAVNSQLQNQNFGGETSRQDTSNHNCTENVTSLVEKPLVGAEDHVVEENFATYSTFVEDGNEYILPNLEKRPTAEGIHQHLQELGEPSSVMRHETETVRRRPGDSDTESRSVVDECVYLFEEEMSQNNNIRHSNNQTRPVSQQPLIDNMD